MDAQRKDIHTSQVQFVIISLEIPLLANPFRLELHVPMCTHVPTKRQSQEVHGSTLDITKVPTHYRHAVGQIPLGAKEMKPSYAGWTAGR